MSVLRSITDGTLDQYIDFRKKEGAKPATIRHELTILKYGFKLSKVPRPEPWPRSNQFNAVCAHLSEDVAAIVTFMFWTGWRKGEVLPLAWSQVDLEASTVRLWTSKNKERRVFPFRVLPAFAAHIDSQREKTEAVQQKRGVIIQHVFRRNGKPIRDFREARVRACTKAGCPGMKPHDFRRTAARRLVRAGVPEKTAIMLLGHKTRSIFDRYNIVNEADLAEGLAKAAAAGSEEAKAPSLLVANL